MMTRSPVSYSPQQTSCLSGHGTTSSTVVCCYSGKAASERLHARSVDTLHIVSLHVLMHMVAALCYCRKLIRRVLAFCHSHKVYSNLRLMCNCAARCPDEETWSKRPLPQFMQRYCKLLCKPVVQLAERMFEELGSRGKQAVIELSKASSQRYLEAADKDPVDCGRR